SEKNKTKVLKKHFKNPRTPGDFRASGGCSSLRKPSLARGFAPFEKTKVMLKGRKMEKRPHRVTFLKAWPFFHFSCPFSQTWVIPMEVFWSETEKMSRKLSGEGSPGE
ncbi:MAG: hypothetical protein ACQESM_10000, partial [Bacteroidota bacterium]